MDRLTKRIDDMVWLNWQIDGRTLPLEPHEITTSRDGTSYVRKMLVRLAAYEDTGLDPEEIERIVDVYRRGMPSRSEFRDRLDAVAGINTDRLRDLGEAERGGRLVVLPREAKEGDLKTQCFSNCKSSAPAHYTPAEYLQRLIDLTLNSGGDAGADFSHL